MTSTRLRVGTKPFRSKPPRSKGPCSEPLVLRNNLLLDPGFENQFNDFGESNLPRYDSVDDRWEWSGVPGAYPPTVVPWSSPDGVDWNFSTTDPRTGTYCLLGDGLPSGTPQPLEANRLFACGGQELPWSARVASGLVVDWEVYVKPSAVGASPGFVTMRLAFFKDTGSSAGTFDTAVNNISTAYTLRSASVVAPVDSYWIAATVRFTDATGDVDTWKVDDARLGIT